MSTLQRCVWTPSQGDQTVTVNPGYDYKKDITVYYRLAGGDGGAGYTGGGGGSSAILPERRQSRCWPRRGGRFARP
ncbi:hypothetical protein GO497_01110 [Acidovorax citrulli]|nr:hypothetical protein [Paracidovorax citrulli]